MYITHLKPGFRHTITISIYVGIYTILNGYCVVEKQVLNVSSLYTNVHLNIPCIWVWICCIKFNDYLNLSIRNLKYRHLKPGFQCKIAIWILRRFGKLSIVFSFEKQVSNIGIYDSRYTNNLNLSDLKEIHFKICLLNTQ